MPSAELLNVPENIYSKSVCDVRSSLRICFDDTRAVVFLRLVWATFFLFFYVTSVSGAFADQRSNTESVTVDPLTESVVGTSYSILDDGTVAAKVRSILSGRTWEEWRGKHYYYSKRFTYESYYDDKIRLFEDWKSGDGFKWLQPISATDPDLSSLKCDVYSIRAGRGAVVGKSYVLSPSGADAVIYKIKGAETDKEIYRGENIFAVFHLTRDSSAGERPAKSAEERRTEKGNRIYFLRDVTCEFSSDVLLSTGYLSSQEGSTESRFYGLGTYHGKIAYFEILSLTEGFPQHANLSFYFPAGVEMDDEGVRLLGGKKGGEK